MAIIEVDHLNKRYRDAVAVEDVSFTLRPGPAHARQPLTVAAPSPLNVW
jgi:ABC-type branched-subunit amino acid transport system ATPase component